jgi:hypothetical protein
MRRFTLRIITLIMLATAGMTQAQEPYRVLARHEHFRPEFESMQVDADQLIFSQYDASGNSFEIRAIGADGGPGEVLVTGRRDARFVARNEEFVVFHEAAGSTRALVTVNRRSGRQEGRIKLNSFVNWGRIHGRQLIALQHAADAFVIDLPDMKIRKLVPVPHARSAASWGERIVVLGEKELKIFGPDWEERASLQLPVRTRNRGHSCGSGPVNVQDDKAVFAFGCGLLVVDLPTLSVDRHIPTRSMFTSWSLLEGLVIGADAGTGRQPPQSLVYDPNTGRELAWLPSQGTHLVAASSFLFSLDYRWPQPSLIRVLAYDAQRLRSQAWTRQQVAQHCRPEALPGVGGDPLAFIDACEAAGVTALLEPPLAAEVLPGITSYAIALSRTLHRYREGILLLEKLQHHGRPEVAAALQEGRHQQTRLEGHPTSDDASLPADHPWRKVVGWSDPRPALASISMNMDPLIGPLQFSGDELLVGRWACGWDESQGVLLAVYTRASFAPARDTKVLPCDDQYQDGVSSIASDKHRIYLSVDFRYPQAGRPNLLVLNRRTLNVIASRAVKDDIHELVIDNGSLLSCNCSGAAYGECRSLDWRQGILGEPAGRRCAGMGIDGPVTLPQGVLPSQHKSAQTAALTRHHVAGLAPAPDSGNHLWFVARDPGSTTGSESIDHVTSLAGSLEHDVLLMSQARGTEVRLLTYDLTRRQRRTLAAFENQADLRPVTAIDGKSVYVMYGNDLWAFDVHSGRLHAHLRALLPGEDGKARQRVSTLRVDSGRLIFLPANGNEVWFIPATALR